MFKRGQFEAFDRIYLPRQRVLDVSLVVKKIDECLTKKDAFYAAFNMVVRSPTVKNEYGVVARTTIQAGVVVGFFKGIMFSYGQDKIRCPNHEYILPIGRNQYIDAHSFTSCFARYYNCPEHENNSNIQVQFLSDWTDPREAIRYVTTKDILEGEELLVSYPAAYWMSIAMRMHTKSELRMLCHKMISNLKMTGLCYHKKIVPTTTSSFCQLIGGLEQAFNDKNHDDEALFNI